MVSMTLFSTINHSSIQSAIATYFHFDLNLYTYLSAAYANFMWLIEQQ